MQMACCETCLSRAHQATQALRRRLQALPTVSCVDSNSLNLLQSVGFIGFCAEEIGWMWTLKLTCEDFERNTKDPLKYCCESCATISQAHKDRVRECVDNDRFVRDRYGVNDCATWVQMVYDQGLTCDTQMDIYTPRMPCCATCELHEPPECVLDSDCSDTQSCVTNVCRDWCYPLGSYENGQLLNINICEACSEDGCIACPEGYSIIVVDGRQFCSTDSVVPEPPTSTSAEPTRAAIIPAPTPLPTHYPSEGARTPEPTDSSCTDNEAHAQEAGYINCLAAVTEIVLQNKRSCPIFCCATCGRVVAGTCSDQDFFISPYFASCNAAVTSALLEGRDCTERLGVTGALLENVCCSSCGAVALACRDYDDHVYPYADCGQAVDQFYLHGRVCNDTFRTNPLSTFCCSSCAEPCVDTNVTSFGYNNCLDWYAELRAQGRSCNYQVTDGHTFEDLCCYTCKVEVGKCVDYPWALPAAFGSCHEAVEAVGCDAALPGGAATARELCCASCTATYAPECLDHEVFLESEYSSCADALLGFNSKGLSCSASLSNGIKLNDACCATCETAATSEHCVDYPTFITAYFASCSHATALLNCSDSIADTGVALEEVCCHTCSMTHTPLCHDYDYFVISHETCVDAVAAAYSNGKDCTAPMGNATLENVCCNACAQPDICADYNLFINGTGHRDCAHALAEHSGDCTALLDGVPLQDICCDSCRSQNLCIEPEICTAFLIPTFPDMCTTGQYVSVDGEDVQAHLACPVSCGMCSLDQCGDYPTFLTPYYTSCLNALTANGGNCDTEIEVEGGIVKLEAVCCSSCQVWREHSEECVDYDLFLFNEFYETCAEAVSTLVNMGSDCTQPVGGGTYEGICCASCAKVRGNALCVDADSLCGLGFPDCTAAVRDLAAKGFRSCGLFPGLGSSCCLSCATLARDSGAPTCGSRRRLAEPGQSVRGSHEGEKRGMVEKCEDLDAFVGMFSDHRSCAELLDRHPLVCFTPWRRACCRACEDRARRAETCVPETTASHTQDAIHVFDPQALMITIDPSVVSPSSAYNARPRTNRIFDHKGREVWVHDFGPMDLDFLQIMRWSGMDPWETLQGEWGSYPHWALGATITIRFGFHLWDVRWTFDSVVLGKSHHSSDMQWKVEGSDYFEFYGIHVLLIAN